MNFNLAAPKMLWLLLLVVPPLVLFLVWAWRKRQELITQFISARLLGTLKVGVSPSRQKMRMALLVVAVIFLILSLARPQWGFTMEEAKQRGLDIIVAIDTSNSMLAEDLPPNRLARAKLAALDLMRRAKSDRLGLIAFAGSAFLQCPLTLDDSAFGQSVDSLDTHSISQGGTALAEAIDTAQKAFKDEAQNHKVLVLFTDGEDHDSEAVKTAEAAAKEGMRIFTIGIGTPEGELLRIRDERGRVDYIRDEAGNPVKSHLNEALLQEIASKSGGFYLPLRGAKTMDTLYEKGLAPLPKSTTSSKLLRRYHERFHWLVGVAIILLLVEMFLPDRQRRRSKATAAAANPLTAVPETVALLLVLALPIAASGSPSQALREYEAGKYQDALKDYRQLLEKKKDDPRLNFNAGAAAYQNRQLDEAAKQFNEALVSPDLQMQQRAYYNLGNTYYRLGQQGAAGANQGTTPPGAPAEAKMKAWEQAVKNYESALKLNPQDEDAKFNRSFVQQQLEELKKQQQQQQSNDKDKSDQKKNQDQKNQDQKNQDQKDQDKQQQSKQDSSQQKDSQAQNQKPDDQKSDQKQQEKQDKQDKQDGKQSQAQQKDKADKKDQNAQSQSGEPKEQSKEEAEREAAMMAAGQMTPQQAQQLLDAQKGNEEVLRLAPPDKKQNNQNRSFKNW